MTSIDEKSGKIPTPNTVKSEIEPIVISSPSKPLPSPSKVIFPPLPPSTPVGNWILTAHSFAPQREYFMRFCAGLAQRRITDHLMWFRFPGRPMSRRHMVPVHYSRLAWIGGPLAHLLIAPPKPAVSMEDNARMPDADPSSTIRSMTPVEDEEAIMAVDSKINEPDAGATTGALKKHSDDPPWLMADDDEIYVRDAPVDLTEGDTPRTFAIVVKFLYCEEICFNYLTFDEIVVLAKASHRWALTDLYNATFSYVMDQNLLAGGHGIRTFIPLVSHAETPENFRRYFCIAVGHHFDVLYPRLKAQAATESSLGAKARTRPALWDVVMKQKMLSHVIHCIRLYSKNSYDEYLLNVIMRYCEVDDDIEDEDIIGLLSQLNWDNIDVNSVFSRDGASASWSARAIRLAALASYAPQTEALEVRIPWNIPLQRLLKTEIWSFQTEHVFCGPYICYLHVRKNKGPELSLFVHIWNRDGKPIGDDVRHEKVRVMCRATESNCLCDSGKQWSDSSHGFLENLKFEGKMQRYPGLGWSQFLEARRLEEWQSCHGEECGLAITTVLQFVNPAKQFEGPARRNVRSNSPTKLVSPIQKKRTGTKKKFRESR